VLHQSRLIASGRVIEFESDIRFKLDRVDFKSWNQIVDLISNVKIDNLIRFLELKSKFDSKKLTRIAKTTIFSKFYYF